MCVSSNTLDQVLEQNVGKARACKRKPFPTRVRVTDRRAQGNDLGYIMLPAHYGLLLLSRLKQCVMQNSSTLLCATSSELFWCSGLSFFNFLLSVAFAVTELQLAVHPPPLSLYCSEIAWFSLMLVPQVTYTFLLYAPSSLAIGQICGILAYLLYPAAGQAASAPLPSYFNMFAHLFLQ